MARASPLFAATCQPARLDSATLATRWAPPLDRLVTAHGSDVSLRDALDRVAVSARLRMSYNTELLPLTRAVCLSADNAPAGRVLAELLSGTSVAAMAVGGDQVVLAPRREPLRAPQPEMAPSLGVLDRVVVTGSANAVGAPERQLSVGLSVLDGRQLARENTTTIADALDAYVPGVWGWAQSPSSLVSAYASIRGASSFGLSYPKVYIDGIEVANPLLLSRFNPGSIDRIEVIRGPQGSALYGTDAISGVVNIVTRHEGAAPDGTHAVVRSTAGVSQSSYANDVLAQDHSLSIATGTSTRSADLHIAAGSIGSFVPDGYSRDLMATGSARIVQATSSLSTTARLFVERAGTPTSPLIPNRVAGDTSALAHEVPQAVSEYTVGATGTTMIDDQWTMSLVAGVDGYRLTNVQTNFTPIPSVLDSALRAAEGGADRATIRASSVQQFSAGDALHATLTIAGEHSTLRVSSVPVVGTDANLQAGRVAERASEYAREVAAAAAAAASGVRVVGWQNSTGLMAQTNVALANNYFLTGGVRFEHDSRLAGVDQIETLPMLGAAAVATPGPFTVKLRGSYGKGIRPPSTPSRLQFWQTENELVAQNALGPERQSGYEAGVDVMLRNTLTLQATRFDQRASGLIQPVGIPADTAEHSHRMVYVAQNVGEIANLGWELQGAINLSPLVLNGTFSLVDSRVRKLATGYTGDLVTGDRVLQVPARTESFSASWTAAKWHASMGASRAFDWINYDEILLAQAAASDTHSARDLSGPRLRQYWRNYTGGTRLRASASRDIREGFAIELSGDNLLDHQTGEPDNITIIPGRTIMTGLRIKF